MCICPQSLQVHLVACKSPVIKKRSVCAVFSGACAYRQGSNDVVVRSRWGCAALFARYTIDTLVVL